MNIGDLVVVAQKDRYGAFQTWPDGSISNYTRYDEYGGVIIYRPNGSDKCYTIIFMMNARSCSLVLADAPARFTSPCCFSRLIGQMMTHPFTRRLVSGLLLRPAPHTMLRIVFVAVD
jgi:hypothetical protein